MGPAGLDYTVRDRSILLPFYKRFVISPTLRFVPIRVDPNHITHAGHVINLVGVTVLLVCGASLSSGERWPLLAAIACLQLDNWCDNADGAQARRAGRCSALG